MADQSVSKTGPRDFFLYLFATAALYFSAVNVINLLRQYGNYFFPDPISAAYDVGFSASMRLAVAFLIIVFPAYVIAMWVLGRDIDRAPEKRDLWVRRWSLYLTLFLSGVTIIGDLVYLVYSFLGGDMTVRFVLQALAILVVAAAVFAYYLFVLRRQPGSSLALRRTLAIVALAVIAALIIGVFFIIGSPGTNRERAFDFRRVNDLQNIQGQIVYYWQAKQELPETLKELQDPISGFALPRDPETGEQYEYRKTGTASFELCAAFNTDASPPTYPSASVTRPYYEKPTGDGWGENWQHGPGRSCFARTIDPDRYPPLDNRTQ